MTERNFAKELLYSRYTETIYYPSLISIITELCDRIEQLEKRLDQQDEYREEQND
jgi:hypothetical protein